MAAGPGCGQGRISWAVSRARVTHSSGGSTRQVQQPRGARLHSAVAVVDLRCAARQPAARTPVALAGRRADWPPCPKPQASLDSRHGPLAGPTRARKTTAPRPRPKAPKG